AAESELPDGEHRERGEVEGESGAVITVVLSVRPRPVCPRPVRPREARRRGRPAKGRGGPDVLTCASAGCARMLSQG
ncbi:MAG: hypothetical protein U5J97_01685, partial [Trueperaceae bacterium]|nr:hypothetical protein [Trueperaceae bacterium]